MRYSRPHEQLYIYINTYEVFVKHFKLKESDEASNVFQAMLMFFFL